MKKQIIVEELQAAHEEYYQGHFLIDGSKMMIEFLDPEEIDKRLEQYNEGLSHYLS